MRIMAASVHDACILRAIDALMRFLDGQRIDVRPQNEHFSVLLFAFQRAEHAGFAHARVRDAEPVQLFLNALRGAELL